MKIYKLASNGKIILRLTTNKANGEYEVKIVGHTDGASCSDGLDDILIQDLLNAEVPGFGSLATPLDEGKTPEYFEDKKTPSFQNIEQENEEDELLSQPEDNRKLDLGYGV